MPAASRGPDETPGQSDARATCGGSTRRHGGRAGIGREMNQDPRNFVPASHDALANPNLKLALSRIKTHFQRGRTIATEAYGDFENMREQGRAIRDYALSHLDTLLETFETRVTARGGKVHWARDAQEAREIVLGILRETGAK